MSVAAADPRADRRVVVAVAVGAGLLALWGLGARSFWLDEAYTASTIDRGFGDLVALTIRDEAYQILHQLLLWPWSRVSTGEWWLRLPSVVAHAATVGAVAVIGRRHVGARAGLIAALILATNGFAIVLAQEARSYPFAMLCSVLALGALLDARSGRTPPMPWVLLAGAAAWFHGFAALASLAPAVVLLPDLVRDAATRRRWLGPLAAGTVLAAVPVVLSATQTDVGNDYAFVPAVSLASVRDVAFTLLGRSTPIAIVTVVGVVGALVELVRDRGARNPPTLETIAAGALVPAAVLVGVSLARPLLLDRYLAASLPAVALLAGIGLGRIADRVERDRALRSVGALALVGALAISALRALDRPVLEDWRGVTAVLAARVEPGDAVLTSVDEELVALEYYRPEHPAIEQATLAWPAVAWGRFGTGDQGPTRLDPTTAAAAVRALPVAPQQVYLVDAKALDGAVARIVAGLPDYRVREVLHLAGVDLVVLSRR